MCVDDGKDGTLCSIIDIYPVLNFSLTAVPKFLPCLSNNECSMRGYI